MATRTISTRLAISGEAEYKAAISRINGELRNLNTGLKETENKFKGQANSIEALRSKGDALAKLQEAQSKKVADLAAAYDNAQKAIDEYVKIQEELSQKFAANEKALEELRKSSEDTSEEEKRLTEEQRKLNEQLAENDKYLRQAEKGAAAWERSLNQAESELDRLNNAIEENDKNLKEAKSSIDGCATSIDEYGNKTNSSVSSTTNMAAVLTAAAAAFKVMLDALSACVEASVEFESAMAGVAKTSDMSDAELAAMGDSIKKLSTEIPATTTEIAGIAEAAGQLGIKKEDILKFTEVMVNLGVATNLSAEEAASALAKFANITGTSADDYERLGSTIVGLGNSFATTEADIVNMGMRVAATGNLVGLTEPQILALATTLSSVGIEAEAGGTAVSTLLKRFETMVATGSPKLADFAKVAGMSAEELSKKWGEDAVGALALFIDGLGKVDESGGSVAATLAELELKDSQLSNAVSALAGSHGLLSEALDTANKSWDENTALAKEAETRYNTTESKLQMLRNAFGNLGVTIGDELGPAIRTAVDIGIELLGWLSDCIRDCPGVGAALAGITAALGILVPAIGLATIATTEFGATLMTITTALVANPLMLAVAGIAAVGTAIFVTASNIEEARMKVEDFTPAAQNLNTVMEESNKTLDDTIAKTEATVATGKKYLDRLTELEEGGLKTATAQKEYKDIIASLNELIPNLNLTINEQTGLLEQNKIAVEGQIEAWGGAEIVAASEKALTEQRVALNAATVEYTANEQAANKAAEDLEKLQKEKTKTEERMQEIQKEVSESMQGQIDLFGMSTAAALDNNEEYKKLSDRYLELDDVINDAAINQKNYSEATIETGKAVEEATTKLDNLSLAHAKLLQDQKDANEVNKESVDSHTASKQAVESLDGKIRELAEAYVEASDSAKESLDSQYGLWEKVGEISTISADKQKEALDSQYGYWEEYQSLMDGLLARGIEGIDEYLAAMPAGTPETVGAMRGLKDASDETVNGIISKWKETEGIKDTLSKNIAAINPEVIRLGKELADGYNAEVKRLGGPDAQPDFTLLLNSVKTAVTNVKTEMETGGKEAAESLATGIEDNASGPSEAAKAMGEGVVNALRDIWDWHSPSKVMHDAGVDLTTGVKEGIEEGADDAVGAVEKMGADLKEKAETAGKETVDAFVERFKEITAKTSAQIDELIAAFDAMDALPGKMEGIGGDIVEGMITGLENKSGALNSAMASIVNGAIEAGNNAAERHSPSKKTIAMFEDVGEGMIIGIENKRQQIADSVQRVVNKALEFETKNYTAVDNLLSMMNTRDQDFAGRVHAANNGKGPNGNIQSMPDISARDSKLFGWMFGGAAGDIVRSIDRASDAIMKHNEAWNRIKAEMIFTESVSIQSMIRDNVPRSIQYVNEKIAEVALNKISDFNERAIKIEADAIHLNTKSVTDQLKELIKTTLAAQTEKKSQANDSMPQIGEINVSVTAAAADYNNAADIGRTIGAEIKRELRYKGVV